MHIAIHLEAVHKPKALKAAARLGMQPQEFVLQVMAPVWIFAAMNNDGSGDVTGLDDDVLAAITFGRCKCLQVLIDTGWLHKDGDNLQVPRWLEHEPYFAEKARDRQRKRAERLAKSQGSPKEVPAKAMGVPSLEEKRGEEKKDTTLSADADDARTSKDFPEDFKRFYEFYPRKVKPGTAFNVWKRMSAAEKIKAIDRAEWVQGCWKHHDPDRNRISFCPHPATWLSGKGWQDADSEVVLAARGR